MLSKVRQGSGEIHQPFRGAFDTEAFNKLNDLLVTDIANIIYQFNKVIGMLQSLPDGTNISLGNAENGIDGKVIFSDKDADDTLPDLYKRYLVNSSTGNPNDINTIVKLIADDYQTLVDLVANVGTSTSVTLTGDSFDTSEITNHQEKFAKDLYATGVTALDGTATAVMAQSIEESIESLSLSIASLQATAATVPLDQTDINTGSVSDAFTGTPGDINDELNEIRTAIRGIYGGTSFVDVPSGTLQNLPLYDHTNSVGTGVVSATNIHGLSVQDAYDAGDFADADTLSKLKDVFEYIHNLKAKWTVNTYVSGNLTSRSVYDSDPDPIPGTPIYSEVYTYVAIPPWTDYLSMLTITVNVGTTYTMRTEYAYTGTPGTDYSVTERTYLVE